MGWEKNQEKNNFMNISLIGGLKDRFSFNYTHDFCVCENSFLKLYNHGLDRYMIKSCKIIHIYTHTEIPCVPMLPMHGNAKSIHI